MRRKFRSVLRTVDILAVVEGCCWVEALGGDERSNAECQDTFQMWASAALSLLFLKLSQERPASEPHHRPKSRNMIIRSFMRASTTKTVLPVARQSPIRGFRATRRYSTSSHAAPDAAPLPQSHASMLGTITADLDRIAPRFEINDEDILILKTPTEFYETLKVRYFCF